MRFELWSELVFRRFESWRCIWLDFVARRNHQPRKDAPPWKRIPLLNSPVKIGLIERNPGYGHPLRPEFRLTPEGEKAGAIASSILSLSDAKKHDALRRAWTVPVLASLHKASHFNDIRRNLFTITDRALSQSLKGMEDINWVRRSVNDSLRPPRPVYHAINTGHEISTITGLEIDPVDVGKSLS